MNFDMNKMMKQFQSIQQKLMEAQKNQANKEFEGIAAGGDVKIIISPSGVGSYRVKKTTINPSLITAEDAEILEDLIMAAFNDAMKKAEEDNNDTLSNMLPSNLKFPF